MEKDLSLKKAVFCMLVSAFGFALMGLFVGMTDHYGTPVSSFQKSFFRNIVAFFIAGSLFLRSGSRIISITPEGWRTLLLRSIFGAIGIFANFYALSHIEIGAAQALNKTSPFFAVMFSWMFLKERLSLRQAIAIGGAFIGSLLIVKPSSNFGSFFPGLCGLIGGIGAGAAYTCVHRLGQLNVDAKFIVFFFSAFSSLLSVPFMVAHFDPMTWQQSLILCGAGSGAAIGQFGITWAYKFAQPRRIAVYDYSNIVFTCILGWMFLDQLPDAASFIGIAIIIIMALAINRHR